jgi:hypothetical protein
MKNYILLLFLNFGTLDLISQVALHTEINSKTQFSNIFWENTLDKLEHAQGYDAYVKVKNIYDIIEVLNFTNKVDTLILYFIDTKFYSDNRKTKHYLRVCFLSQPFQFYQVEIGNKKSGYTVGIIDQKAKTIEILRNDLMFASLSELCYTIME